MLGYEKGELDGAPWSNHTHPDDIAKNQLLTDQLVRGEIETFQLEKRYLHKDGSVVWAHLNASIVGDDVEIPRFRVTMIEDISERKSMQESLLASERRYRSLIEDQPEFICRYKPDGRMVYANSAMAKQHGFYPDDVAEQNIFDFLVESDHGRTIEYIAQLRPEQESARIKLQAQIADGSIRWQEWSDRAFFDDRGRILEIQAFGRDVTDRKNAEEMLRKSEGRLAEAQQLAQIGSWELNFKTENPTWSDQMYRLYGVDPGAAPPSTDLFFDRVHPDDREEVQRAVSGQKTRGRAHDYSHRVLRQDGQIGYVQQRVEQVFDELGELIGVRGTTQDITNLKRTADELQESEESLRLITDNVPALISYVDDERRYRFMNERYEEWTGKPNSEHLGRQIWETLGPEYYARLDPWITRALRGERVRFETHNSFADGIPRYLDIEYVPDIDANGRTKGYYSVSNDITERKMVENALRESGANLSRAQIISGVGSWSWDIATNFNHWSAEHYRIFGMEPTGAPVSYDEYLSMVHEEDREMVDAALKEAVRTGETYEIEYRVVRKDGKIRRAQATGEVEHDESGKPVTMRGALQDITEHSQVEEQLRQAQKMEAIGQLTGGIAHDFNNLLAVILGNLELISERVKGDADIDDLIERGLSASDRGAALTHRLLAFSRKQTLRPTRTDLNKLVANMTDMLNRTLGETIEIRTQGTIDLWPCATDQAQFENALLNLSINARDAMPGGGTLTIETANLSLTDNARATEVELTPGEYVQLSVSDTGNGIPAEALEHVFEPFFTTKDVGKGSGMGLSMVYGFAKQSGGTVTITSTPGQGTIVHLYLPRSSEVADPPVARLAAADIPTADGEKILLVEDDNEVRALAVEMLTGLGYDIAEANCAEAALDLLNQSASFDLLLTDVVLPGAMSGPDLATKVRHLRPDIKELFMTGYAEGAFSGQMELHGASRILQKPFRKAGLATIVRDVLDKR